MKKVALLFSGLTLILQIACMPETKGPRDGEDWVLIYGNSISSKGKPANCQWCGPLIRAGLRISNMSEFGARMQYDAPGPSLKCEAPDWSHCERFGEYQISRLEGQCRRTDQVRWDGDTAAATCLEDWPTLGQEVDVFFFGTNDVTFVSVSTWDSITQSTVEAAWVKALDASAAAGHRCVVVLAPPAFNPTQPDPLDSDIKLVKLNAFLSTEVAANRPLCVVADVYSAFRAVEASHGLQAMLDMYADPACTTTANGCIHPADGPTAIGVRPNELIGEIILSAIRRVQAK